MISNKYKCVFVHIPKTAGQSVEQFFLAQHGLSWEERSELLLSRNADPMRGPERLAHLTALEYINLGYLERSLFDEYYKFSVVRNPWERLVSEYNYRDYHERFSFSDFVLNGLPEKDIYTDRWRHLIPQSDYLYGESGELLVDFIVRFESLERDFGKVCASLGIEFTKLPHVNVSVVNSGLVRLMHRLRLKQKKVKRHYTEYYCSESRAFVEEFYARDIEGFGYEFGV